MTYEEAEYLIGMTEEDALVDLQNKNMGMSIASRDNVASFELIESDIVIVYVDIVDGKIDRIVRIK